MISKVIQRNIHISHRKASLVIDLVRHKPVAEAIRILKHTNKKIAPIILKLLNSAISNVQHNSKSMDPSKLYVYKIVANQGPTMKRNLPRAKGSADKLFKRTTHLEIVLSDDINERENELLMIKTKKQTTLVNSTPNQQPPLKSPQPQEPDLELQKREQQNLKAVEKKPSKDQRFETTEIIMISTTSKHAETLFNDPQKNVIFYKNTPVNQVLRVLVYVIAPIKKVVGEFDLERIEIGALSTLWKKFGKHAVISKKEFDMYYEGKNKAHALISKKTFKYTNPKNLNVYAMNKGPSGFQYLK